MIDANQKGFSLAIELNNLERYIVILESPLDVENLISMINKAKNNLKEIKNSIFDDLKYNVDYYEHLLKNEIHQDFTLNVIY